MAKTITDKIADTVTEVKAEKGQQALVKADARQNQTAALQTIFELGQIVGVKKTADYLSLRALRAMETFIQEKQYIALGYPTVAEFFKSDYLAIKKTTYYESKKLVEQEGEELYELFEQIGDLKKARLQLGDGTVRLEGNEVIIGETRVPKDNEDKIILAFKGLVAENQALKAKAEKQDEQIKQGGKDLKELKKQLDAAKKGKVTLDTPSHDRALMFVVEAFKLLTEEAEALAAEDVAPAREKALALIEQLRDGLLKAYQFEVPEIEPAVKPHISKAKLKEFADAEEDD